MDKREFLKLLGAAALGGAATHVAGKLDAPESAPSPKTPDGLDSLKRVLESGVLRAAYILVPPEMAKDQNTGNLSGICYDLTEKLAQKIDIKVDWVEEVGFGNFHEGLNNRYDALCFTFYRYARPARVVDFTQPLFYSAIGVYVRPGDTRFTNNLKAIDDPAITIATIDGEMSSVFAVDRFPRARVLSLPQNSSLGDLLLNVTSGKADVTFVNATVGHKFMANNPGKLVNISKEKPIAIFSHGFVVVKGDTGLRDLFDIGFSELLDSGVIEDILRAHEPFPGAYLRVTPPYATVLN